MTPRFEVQSFEQVPAGPGTVLLRIAGRWVGPARERLPTPLLLVDDGRRTHRLSGLPGPDDVAPMVGPDGPPWRGAFSASAALVAGGRLAFALEAGRGVIVDLPRPTGRGGAALVPAPAPAPASPPAPAAAAAPVPLPDPESGRGRGGGFRRRGRGTDDEPRPTFDAADLARASDLAALQARLAEERAAREDADRRAA
ncbi:MAG: hypothetical protein QOK49_4857, partial [Baekduia sp.]|nr:hypothetical protein [Baekduia sp.]